MEIEYPTRVELERAKELYASDDINIDDEAQASHTVDGVWIQAWVWVGVDE